MSDASLTDRAERYLLQRMSPAEREAFQRELETNAALREKLTWLTQVQMAMGWKRSLRDLDQEMEQAGFFEQFKEPPRRQPRRWWVAAAAVILLLLAGWWFWAGTQVPAWEELAVVALQDIDLEAAGGVRNANYVDANVSNVLNRALMALAQEDYAAAESYLTSIPVNDDAFVRVQLLRSFAALSQGDYPLARQLAQNAGALAQRSSDQHKADWLALKASIGAQNPDRQLLEQIVANEAHRFHAQAQELQAQLP